MEQRMIDSLQRLGDELCVHPKLLWRVLYDPGRYVSIDAVDTALLNADILVELIVGTDIVVVRSLDDLYPTWSDHEPEIEPEIAALAA
jgi:hypothetical protein